MRQGARYVPRDIEIIKLGDVIFAWVTCDQLSSNVRGSSTIVPRGEVSWVAVTSDLGEFKGSNEGPGDGDDEGNKRNRLSREQCRDDASEISLRS